MIYVLKCIWTAAGIITATVLAILAVLALIVPQGAPFTPLGSGLILLLAVYLAINCGLMWEKP